jgi:mRNA interferase RelE/StbE
VKRYEVYVTPAAWREIKDLPGYMKQRVKRAVEAMASDPALPGSRCLDVPGCRAEVRRVRLDQWRLLYAVSESERIVDVLAVRKRPPYDYGDLTELIAELR